MKYYVEKVDAVMAEQWNGNELVGVTTRAGRGYVSIKSYVTELQIGDWVIRDGRKILDVMHDAEFMEKYEFLREDDYELGNGEALYKNVSLDNNWVYNTPENLGWETTLEPEVVVEKTVPSKKKTQQKSKNKIENSEESND